MGDNYWEKRAINIEKLTQERADVDIMHVNKLFDGAIEIIEKQIEEIFGKYARDSCVSPDAALRLLNEDQTDTLRRNLMITLAQCQEEVARQAILARLNAPAYAARISRLEALKDLVYSQAYMVGADAHRRLENRLIDTYSESYYRSIYGMQRRTETGFDFTKLADRDVQAAIETEWAGSNYSKRIWKNTDMLAKSLEQVITQGLMTGQSIRNIDLALEAKIDGGRYNINRVIRTEVNNCCNQGTLKSYKAAEYGGTYTLLHWTCGHHPSAESWTKRFSLCQRQNRVSTFHLCILIADLQQWDIERTCQRKESQEIRRLVRIFMCRLK